MSDDSSLSKVEESFATDIKQEVDPFNVEVINEPKEEIDTDSSIAHSNAHETEDQTEL